jgi:serine protease
MSNQAQRPHFVRSLILMSALLASVGAQAFQRTDRNAVQTDAGATAGMTDRVIVKYKDSASNAKPNAGSLAGALQAGGRFGVSISHHRRMSSGADVLKLDRRMTGDQIKRLLVDMKSADGNIEYIEPDRVLHAMGMPNDPMYNQQWSLYDSTAGINAPNAWNLATGAGVVVAVVDTGIRPHADLVHNLLTGYDFVSTTQVSNDGDGRDADPSDPGDAIAADFCGAGSAAQNSSWHGTHVAGIIAATGNNAVGVIGAAYNAKILPVRVLGRCGGYTSDIADGIAWAAGGAVLGVPTNTRPANVINLSLGGAGVCDTTMQVAINKARSLGAMVIVAAGNGSSDASQSTPASCHGVVSVAGVGLSGGRAYYSNYGSIISLAAPGGDLSGGIVSTGDSGEGAPAGDNYTPFMGTSMAAPHVSAVAALMLSRNRTLTPDQAASMLKSTVRPFPADCSGCGAGLVDAYGAVAAATAASGSTRVVSEGEPNNTRATAQFIPFVPILVHGTIKTSLDLDYFKVNVPAGGKVVSTLVPSAQVNYGIWVYDASGNMLNYSLNGAGQSNEVVVSNTRSAPIIIYVLVAPSGGPTGVVGTYTLSFSR